MENLVLGQMHYNFLFPKLTDSRITRERQKATLRVHHWKAGASNIDIWEIPSLEIKSQNTELYDVKREEPKNDQ